MISKGDVKHLNMHDSFRSKNENQEHIKQESLTENASHSDPDQSLTQNTED